MRYQDNGSFYTVFVSLVDIETFNSNWPCSSIARRACYFQFQKSNGDLVDTNCKGDGAEVLALSEGCQKYAARKTAVKFRDLKVGDTFDFIDDARPGYNSFFRRVTKISARRYCDGEITYTVGTINCNVYHVNEKRG